MAAGHRLLPALTAAVGLAGTLAAGCRPDPPGAGASATSTGRSPQGGDGQGPARRSGPTPVPTLHVPALRDGDTIRIDGVLDEGAWQRAGGTGPFVNVGNGGPADALPIGGRARLLWDRTGFYVGLEVRDRTVRGGFPADATDPHLWERDTIELMIDPDGDGDNRDYYEIQVNPQNLVFDSQFDRYNLPRGGPSGPFGHETWSAGLQSAVTLHGTIDDDSDVDEGYTVEVRVPWSSLAKARRAPPADGDEWRMNFYAMQNNGGVAWSPILGQGNFHRASRFGRVRWMAAPTER